MRVVKGDVGIPGRPLSLHGLIGQYDAVHLQERQAFVATQRAQREARSQELSQRSVQQHADLVIEKQQMIDSVKSQLGAVEAQFSRELQSRVQSVQSWRQEHKARSAAVTDQMLSARAENAKEIRRTKSTALNKNLAEVTLLDVGDLKALSVQMNTAMAKVAFRDRTETRAWIKIFRHIDADDSGWIGPAELSHVVRSMMGLSVRAVSEEMLRRLWRSLDIDASGLISHGEFGAFMRMGEQSQPHSEYLASQRQQQLNDRSVEQDRTSAELSAQMANSKEAHRRQLEVKANLVRKQCDEDKVLTTDAVADLLRSKQQRAGDVRKSKAVMLSKDIAKCSRLDEERVGEVSVQMNKALTSFIFKDRNETQAWIKIFRHLEIGDSGLISPDELKHAVRVMMHLSKQALSDETLHSLWRTLDIDASGFISHGEFGAFMQIGQQPRTDCNMSQSVASARESVERKQETALEARADRATREALVKEARARASIDAKEYGKQVRGDRKVVADASATAMQEMRRARAMRAKIEVDAVAAELVGSIEETRTRANAATGWQSAR